MKAAAKADIAEALRRSEARLDLAARAADLGIWDWDVITNEMIYSERAKAIFGFAAGAPVTFEQVRQATHPDDLPHTSAMARRALDPQAREKRPYEYRIIRPDGSVRWVVAHGEAVFADPAKQAVRYVGTIQDVTSRKNTEQALRDSEARLQLAIDAGRMAVWEYDLSLDSLNATPELNRLLGFDPGAALSFDEIRKRYYPGEDRRLRAAWEAALQKGERHFEVEFRYVWPDRSVHWLLLRAEIRLSADDVPVAMIGALIDISEGKRSEDALRESEERYRALVHASAVIEWRADADGSMFDAPLWALYTGQPAEEHRGWGWLNVLHPDDREATRRIWEDAHHAAQVVDIEYRIFHEASGTYRWVHDRGVPLMSRGDRVREWVGIVADIHERRQSEEQQKLLMNELNHRVKNTLAIVQAIVSQTMKGAQAPADAYERVRSRLMALSGTHDLLTARNWLGAPLVEVLRTELKPYRGGEGRVTLKGPPVDLDAKATLALGLIAHELAVNAVKYGALSSEHGRVEVTWSTRTGADERRLLELNWLETGGPRVAAPAQQGFGSRLIQRSVAGELSGNVEFHYASTGLSCRIVFPLVLPARDT